MKKNKSKGALNPDLNADRKGDVDKKAKSQIAILQKFGENYSSKILNEQKKLDENIKEIQSKIEEQRKLMKNVPNERETTEQVAKEVK